MYRGIFETACNNMIKLFINLLIFKEVVDYFLTAIYIKVVLWCGQTIIDSKLDVSVAFFQDTTDGNLAVLHIGHC